jgi:hypothetical protein
MAVRLVPAYGHWSPSAAARMDEDLVFDHDDAGRDVRFFPQRFCLTPEDVP